jgi:hypothetical protein
MFELKIRQERAEENTEILSQDKRQLAKNSNRVGTEYKCRELPLRSPARYRTTFIIRIVNTADGGMAEF